MYVRLRRVILIVMNGFIDNFILGGSSCFFGRQYRNFELRFRLHTRLSFSPRSSPIYSKKKVGRTIVQHIARNELIR